MKKKLAVVLDIGVKSSTWIGCMTEHFYKDSLMESFWGTWIKIKGKKWTTISEPKNT
jgi:hypothetical protein